jgi:hypothetical protein
MKATISNLKFSVTLEEGGIIVSRTIPGFGITPYGNITSPATYRKEGDELLKEHLPLPEEIQELIKAALREFVEKLK